MEMVNMLMRSLEKGHQLMMENTAGLWKWKWFIPMFYKYNFKCNLSSVTYKLCPLEIHCLIYFIDQGEKSEFKGF